MTRRTLLAGAAALPSVLRAADPKNFFFAVIADTHIIDEFYKAPAAADDSILQTTARLSRTRDHLNALKPRLEKVFLVGDYFHDYPSPDLDFYYKNRTRIDAAKALTDSFAAPVHVGFGNHDYDVPRVSREGSHELFRRKLGVEPYYSVDHKGFRFIHLNNFLGVTWQPGHARYDKSKGSLGEQQLNWLESQLADRKPSFIFVHFPLYLIERNEAKDYGLPAILKKNKDTVQRVISGHWHKWFEFGRSYGPQHLVIAATRFDPNAYLIVEADPRKASHRLLNIDLVDWDTHYSRPWPSS